MCLLEIKLVVFLSHFRYINGQDVEEICLLWFHIRFLLKFLHFYASSSLQSVGKVLDPLGITNDCDCNRVGNDLLKVVPN